MRSHDRTRVFGFPTILLIHQLPVAWSALLPSCYHAIAHMSSARSASFVLVSCLAFESGNHGAPQAEHCCPRPAPKQDVCPCWQQLCLPALCLPECPCHFVLPVLQGAIAQTSALCQERRDQVLPAFLLHSQRSLAWRTNVTGASVTNALSLHYETGSWV